MLLRSKSTTLNPDPLIVFERLVGQHDQCFLLETLVDDYQPQSTSQSYIGIAPDHCYAARGNTFYVDGQPQASPNPYDSLRKQITFDTSLPGNYVGGLVGYFAHEGISQFEPTIKFGYKRQFFDFEFGRFSDGLVFSPGKSPDYFYYQRDRSDLYARPSKTKRSLKLKFVGSAKDLPSYNRTIHKALEDIKSGRVFQVEVGNRYDYNFSGDLINLYRELRRINPSPFMFFLKFGNVVTFGAGPELLVQTQLDGMVYSEVLAGAIRRGKTPEEDGALAAQMSADEKEVAEHSMLVDLHRNDLGRICQIGSVKIEELMYIKKFSHVQHLASLISGRLVPELDAFDALAATFPAGTLSGAPKIEAIKMIAEAELDGYERGPYGGTAGYFSYNGNSMHTPNLRSVSALDNTLSLQVASGIVYDSTPENEYNELGYKKAAMEQAMKPFLNGGEV